MRATCVFTVASLTTSARAMSALDEPLAIRPRTGALPRLVGIGAAVTAAALAVNGAIVTTDFVPALLLFVLWTLATSVALFRSAGAPAAPALARPAATA